MTAPTGTFNREEVAKLRLKYALDRLQFGVQHQLADVGDALSPLIGASPAHDRIRKLYDRVHSEWYKVRALLERARPCQLDREYDPQYDDRYIAGAAVVEKREQRIGQLAHELVRAQRRTEKLEAFATGVHAIWERLAERGPGGPRCEDAKALELLLVAAGVIPPTEDQRIQRRGGVPVAVEIPAAAALEDGDPREIDHAELGAGDA